MNISKRTMHHPEAFVGKRIDSTKWNIPDGYERCEMTGKLFKGDTTYSFPHWMFNRQFLKIHGIYVEDAAWLSEEGYYLILAILERLDVLNAFYEGWDHEQDFIDGRCEITAAGLVWEAPPFPVVTSVAYSIAA